MWQKIIAFIRCFFRTYRREVPLLLLYPALFLCYFGLQLFDLPFHDIYSTVDAAIPFHEAMVLPYVLWYPYIPLGMIFFMVRDKKELLRFLIYLYTGMVCCFVIFAVFPTSFDHRPETFTRDNLLTKLVGALYGADRPTNVLPSMHCYNALALSVALHTPKRYPKKRIVCFASWSFTLLVCLSTMMIKQHSIWDFVAAAALCGVLFPLAYGVRWKFLDRAKPSVPWHEMIMAWHTELQLDSTVITAENAPTSETIEGIVEEASDE